jgi:hypothetical protein
MGVLPADARTLTPGSAGGGRSVAVVAAQAARAAPPAVRPRLGSAAISGDWPLPAHDLSATRPGSPGRGVRKLWRVNFPGGVPASAAVLGERVYAASAKGEVAALALRDGKHVWRVSLSVSRYGSGQGVRELGLFATGAPYQRVRGSNPGRAR